MATISRVQEDVDLSGSDTRTVVFPSTPTDGNLLVVYAQNRSGVSAADATISGTDWSKFLSQDVQINEASWRRATVGWWKQAGASEPTNVTVTWTGATFAAAGREFESDEAATWSFVDVATDDNGQTTDGTSVSLGTTGSIAAQTNLVIGVVGGREDNEQASAIASFASLNLTDVLEVENPSASFEAIMNIGWLQSDAAGTKTSTATISSGNNTGLNGSIAVFSSDAASGLTASGTPSIESPTASGVAKIIKRASGTAAIAAVVASGVAGLAGQSLTAGGTPAIDALTASGSVIQIQKPSGTPSITTITASGAATKAGTLTASGTPSLSVLTASGLVNLFGGSEGTPTLDVITASGTATLVGTRTASGTPSAPTVSASGSITQTYLPSGTPSLPVVTASGVATLGEKTVTGTVTIDGVTASGAVVQTLKPSGAVTLGAVTASGTVSNTGVRTASGTPSIAGITASGVALGPQSDVTDFLIVSMQMRDIQIISLESDTQIIGRA